MEDAKADNAPIRFFAIGYGSREGYYETFMFATSAEDALKQYIGWIRSNDGNDTYTHKFKIDVLEAELNKFGVMMSTDIVIQDREIEC